MYTDTRKQQGKGSVLVPAKFHPSAGDPGASQCQLLVQLGKRHPLIIWVNVPQDWAELIGFWKRCQNIAHDTDDAELETQAESSHLPPESLILYRERFRRHPVRCLPKSEQLYVHLLQIWEEKSEEVSSDRNCHHSACSRKENYPSKFWGWFGSRDTAGPHSAPSQSLISGQTPRHQFQGRCHTRNKSPKAAFQAEQLISGKTFCSHKTQ